MAHKRAVVIFKTEQDDDKYTEELNKIGYECRMIPVLKFNFINGEEVIKLLSTPENYSGMILTSPRAVEALKYATQNMDDWVNNLKPKWNKLLIFVVGESTSDLTRSLGFNPLGESSGNAEALSDVIKSYFKSGSNKPLLFPCGNLARDNLAGILSESHISVERLTVYKTEPHDDIKKNFEYLLNNEDEKIHCIVYFSPSGVKYTKSLFSEFNFPIEDYKWIAIGPTTADAMIKAGLPVSGTAEKPNPKSISDVITKCR